MTDLFALGERVARAQDDRLAANSATAEARARLLSTDRASGVAARPARPARWQRWAIAAAAAMAAAGFVAWHRHDGALAFQVGSSGKTGDEALHRGTVGDWIATPTDASLPVTFSDGSALRLEGGTQARIAQIAADGARVVLERGSLHASVKHRPDTRWNVLAGPFDVRVTGTAFQVAWDPTTQGFSLTLEEGRVAVSGCAMGEERVVSAGETFRATCKDGSSAFIPNRSERAVDPPAPPAAPIEPAASPASTGSTAREATRAPDAVDVAEKRAASGWRSLIRAGKYPEAVDAAETLGLASVCATATAAEMMDLADAARFAGRTEEAELLLRDMRRRFPHDERASAAAFYLGRIAFDSHASYRDAARWFDTSIRERPSGALAREASGRLFEALERGGDHEGARQAALRYLDTYPDGPHAPLAKSLAGR
jgi:transmembrane sensor